MFQGKVVEKIHYIFMNFPCENPAVCEIQHYVQPDGPGMTVLHGACAFHTQNMQYLLLLHGNNGYTNPPQCYIYTYTACLLPK